MSPGCLHTFCQSMSGEILFKNIFKNYYYFSRSGSGSISWHFMTLNHDRNFLSWMNENVEIFISNFPHKSPSDFIVKIQNHSSPVTCHLSPVTWHLSRSHSAASCEITGFIDFAWFGKKFINPVPVVQFSNFQRILGGKYLLHDRKY